MPVRLFVGNLPYDVTETELRQHFAAVGSPSQIFLPIDRETGKPRGFAFIEFEDGGQASEAIRRLDKQIFKGRPLAINEARARESRPPGPAAPRPAWSGPQSGAEAGTSDDAARGSKAPRSFGPDAAPRRRGKPGHGPQKDRGPKGPIRERTGGRFFGDDDEALDEGMDEDNFASRVGDSEGEGPE